MAEKETNIPKTRNQQLGIITDFVFRIFLVLKYLPPQVFVEERMKHQRRISKLDTSERDKAIKKRILNTEAIIIAYMVIYVFSIIFNDEIKTIHWLNIIAISIITLRLLDIIQTNVNITFFDALRSGADNKINNNLYSLIRTIILVCYNFLEVAVIFGIIYSLLPDTCLSSVKSLKLSDRFYFSFITQLTIGYGDIIPIGIGKICAAFQGIIGYFFSILIISRLLSSLPKIDALNK